MEQLSYNDVMADLASTVEQYGALRFLADFHNNYPKHFAEISSQIDRETHHSKVPRLLTKYTEENSEGGSDASSM